MQKLAPSGFKPGCRIEPLTDQQKQTLENIRYYQRKAADKARYQRGYRLMGGLWVHPGRSRAEQTAFDCGLAD